MVHNANISQLFSLFWFFILLLAIHFGSRFLALLGAANHLHYNFASVGINLGFWFFLDPFQKLFQIIRSIILFSVHRPLSDCAEPSIWFFEFSVTVKQFWIYFCEDCNFLIAAMFSSNLSKQTAFRCTKIFKFLFKMDRPERKRSANLLCPARRTLSRTFDSLVMNWKPSDLADEKNGNKQDEPMEVDGGPQPMDTD